MAATPVTFDFNTRRAITFACVNGRRSFPQLPEQVVIQNYLSEFTLFPNLPKELRLKILNEALAEEGGAGSYFWFLISTRAVIAPGSPFGPAVNVTATGTSHENLLRKFGAISSEYRAQIFHMYKRMPLFGPPLSQISDGTMCLSSHGNNMGQILNPFNRLINVQLDTLFLSHEDLLQASAVGVGIAPMRIKRLTIWFDKSSTQWFASCGWLLYMFRMVFPCLRELNFCIGRAGHREQLQENLSHGFIDVDDIFDEISLSCAFDQGFKCTKKNRAELRKLVEMIKGYFAYHTANVDYWKDIKLNFKIHGILGLAFDSRAHFGPIIRTDYKCPRYNKRALQFVLLFPLLGAVTECDEKGVPSLPIESIRHLFQESAESSQASQPHSTSSHNAMTLALQ
ncbi:hypothetical protein PVAG01_04872 [Phlyctema vagabunda]|uniref:Uncharacterized protein n=1 Tax=Phlyctema vagabunda TaxID=108571 RepID=A0ABR4PIJ7_9HELO